MVSYFRGLLTIRLMTMRRRPMGRMVPGGHLYFGEFQYYILGVRIPRRLGLKLYRHGGLVT